MEIINSALASLNDIASVFCFTVVMHIIFGYRERKRIITVIAVVLCMVITASHFLLMYFSKDSDLSELIDTLAIIMPFIFAVTVTNVRRVFRYLASLLMILASVETIYGLVAFIFNARPDTIFDDMLDRGFTAFGYILISLLLILFHRKTDLSLVRNTLLSIPKWLYPIWFILTLTVYFTSYSARDAEYDTSNVTHILITVSAICVFGFIIYFIFKLFSLSFNQSQILKQLDEQHSNYENMLTSDRELRQFRHDYKNHIIAVTAFLNAGKTEEAAEYLEAIKVQSGVQKRQISTGSFVADAVLNNKNALAEELGIKMTFTGVMPETGIGHSDICTILGNLVDNAIESLKSCSKEKHLSIETYSRDPFFVISVRNPVDKPVEIKNNRIRTTKSDTKNHGIGLKNIERIAEKYDGKLRLTCDSEEFSADIYLKIKDKKETE